MTVEFIGLDRVEPFPRIRRPLDRERTNTLASSTALAVVTVLANQVFRLRRLGREIHSVGDLGETARQRAALAVPAGSLGEQRNKSSGAFSDRPLERARSLSASTTSLGTSRM